MLNERRKSGRILSAGTAIIHGSCAAEGRIIDLAVGGLSVWVDAPAVPDIGERVRLDVRLDGIGRWMHVSGSVVRRDARRSGTALAIELLVVPQDFEDHVQGELLSELECAGAAQILIVDRSRGRRELVATAFRATGCHVIEVSSPLAAIVEIVQSRLHLWAIVIADTRPASHALDELHRVLGELYPGVPLIDLGQHARTRGSGEDLLARDLADRSDARVLDLALH